MVSRPKKCWQESAKQFLIGNFVRMPVSKIQTDAVAKPVQVIVWIVCQLNAYKGKYRKDQQ